ncbi:hypothetical protein BCR35DRAFT_291450 [Leucosporidium creatinivorum]|uniref:PQ loop repeat-domain-containing protein n=1 Tax=Leucosporidium creatinivorum TaxID=106004 RepID=A0A1Y2F745_9BASI|nr:hypothetical protein BCR35DRAFT_291450 [Leucosporidium creatinivorum]
MDAMDYSPLPPVFAAFHSRPIVSKDSCRESFTHDQTTMILSLLIVIGLVVSYLPQHLRIIRNKNSEGFSPWFLLLGATSSASSLLNILTLQWGQVACCQYLTAGQCFESVLGIAQVFFQWLCFNLIFVLYLVFYPRGAKYVRSLPLEAHAIPPERPWSDNFVPAFMRTSTPSNYIRRPSTSSSQSDTSSVSDFDPRSMLLPGQVRHSTIILSEEYRRALSLFFLTLLHLLLSGVTTAILLVTLPKAPHSGSPPAFPGEGGKEHPSERAVRVWATTLGLASVVLACVQYFPQLLLTARRKLVGSLSIPMMLLQTPGSFVFVYTLAVRPGVNWSGWATYLITGILQGLLLVLCIAWKRRQKRLGIDDWGRSKVLEGEESTADESSRLL